MPVVCRAEWFVASSPNFVVYADDSERDIRTFSQQLERFHAAISLVTNTRPETPSPSNRVTVYVVKNPVEVRKLYGDRKADIGAFYVPRAGGSLAIVPGIKTGTTDLDFSMIALLHEYAHHFMFTSSSFAMPRWYAEGAAEFFASASFFPDGRVGIGRPAQHRAAEFVYARDVKVSELLDTRAERTRKGGDAFYGKSWLLFHYLTFEKARAGQLRNYLRLLSRGSGSLDAGREAFGDLDKLEKELDAYLHRGKILAFTLSAAALETGPIAVRVLREGEAAAMPVRIRSRRGVTLEQASALLPEARAVAARFPQDPAVLAVLAEAEHDAQNYAEAIAAADAALALDPSLVDAYIQKGLSLFRLAAGEADAAAYTRAREPFLALNKLEPDHPLPLIYNYLVFTAQHRQPPENAVNGLRRAAELAPFDSSLRLMLAAELIRRRQFPEAREDLRSVAYNPHGGRVAEAAQRVLTQMEDSPDWDGANLDALLAGLPAD
ncbi:MAG: DUF1570 domain-containing protein [Steroidobacteraceae bacterium]